ncbi:MAG TPA: hypothetical protein PKU87_01950 [Candidatus Atribacteria bacterium]|nr:hypothetical protein [Candidatus Atribacteria bacterium]HQE24923.1 hypothetical protein [Candidatus Atribacteria bacterium]
MPEIFYQASRCFVLKYFGFLIETFRNDGQGNDRDIQGVTKKQKATLTLTLSRQGRGKENVEVSMEGREKKYVEVARQGIEKECGMFSPEERGKKKGGIMTLAVMQ